MNFVPFRALFLANFREFYKGEVHDDMKICIAPPRLARTAGEVWLVASLSVLCVCGHNTPQDTGAVRSGEGLGRWAGAERRMAEAATLRPLFTHLDRRIPLIRSRCPRFCYLRLLLRP